MRVERKCRSGWRRSPARLPGRNLAAAKCSETRWRSSASAGGSPFTVMFGQIFAYSVLIRSHLPSGSSRQESHPTGATALDGGPFTCAWNRFGALNCRCHFSRHAQIFMQGLPHLPQVSCRQQKAGHRKQLLSRIKAPTVVIHGTADKLVRPSGGKATARRIPGARLITIDGMGHDLPREVWPRIVDAIVANARAADGSRPGGQPLLPHAPDHLVVAVLPEEGFASEGHHRHAHRDAAAALTNLL